MEFLKTILHWAGIVFAVLAMFNCYVVVFDSNVRHEGMKTLALAANSIACLQAAQALKDKE